MYSKFLGGILLITGTSIGAGMLGLPIAAAQLGFVGSLILLFVCWFIMLACAFLLLEVNLWLPQKNNLISMAKVSIGPVGQIIAWISYLLLLYSLLCAYIAGGSDLFHNLLEVLGFNTPMWVASIFFTLLFGSVVYSGMSSVDKTNRVFMGVKLCTFFIVALFLLPFISTAKLATGNLYYLTSVSALTVTTASFGWAALIPSLRVYFAGDLKKLKVVIIIGSAIPLICYIIWDAVIMGIIPLSGKNSLEFILHSTNSTSGLVDILNTHVENDSILFFIKLFTSICVLTSFLGVALCLTDFLADGLNIEKKGYPNLLIHSLTFIPSLSIAIFFPNVFIKALEYAGIYATVLLILLPAWMAWSGRYRKGLAKGFTVLGGKTLLVLIIVFALMLLIRGITN
ncbi:amino acid permease [Legionella sp.]|uniref:amino acid permease n=1 Tax=Legionella sp. TaxID=459 RepID=UPI003CAF5ABB